MTYIRTHAYTNAARSICDICVDIDSASLAPKRGRDIVHFQGLKHFPRRDARATDGDGKDVESLAEGASAFFKRPPHSEVRRPTVFMSEKGDEEGGEKCVREEREKWEGNENTDRWGKVYRERCEEGPSRSFHPSLPSSVEGVERPDGGWEGEGEGGRRRERWYVRRIASAFWAPRRFGLPSKRSVPPCRPRLVSFFPPLPDRRRPFLSRRLFYLRAAPLFLPRFPLPLSRRRWRRYLPRVSCLGFFHRPSDSLAKPGAVEPLEATILKYHPAGIARHELSRYLIIPNKLAFLTPPRFSLFVALVFRITWRPFSRIHLDILLGILKKIYIYRNSFKICSH